jgi:hypothetical protein
MFRNRIVHLLVVFMLAGCLGESGHKKGADGDETGQAMTSTDTAGTGVSIETGPAFTPEDAETIVAQHFSRLNAGAKYPLYKGLLLNISQIDSANRDSIRFTTTVDGRKWTTPNGDTATRAFRDTIEFSVFRQNNQWQGIARDKRN